MLLLCFARFASLCVYANTRWRCGEIGARYSMDIRPFRHSDLDAVIEITRLSFAEEQIARGSTPENFARQVRMVARGRLIPFKILTSLAGYKWEILVAELDGKVVGCSGYLGRRQMELANLMVHPDYRRRGIGQALLEKRLERLAQQGYPLAKTTILASNQASLGNVGKQGFEVFDRFSIWESSLPLPQPSPVAAPPMSSRPVQFADAAVFKALEAQIANPLWLEVQGSAVSNYLSSWGERLLNRFTSTQQWARAFCRDEHIVGFLAATTSGGQAKGVLARPVVADENLVHLPAMLDEAAAWLMELGKMPVQMAVPDEREQLAAQLESAGWVKSRSWLRLVKWLK
jgi:ribosomal protein S18 acetylase RimI-like enzyme